MITITAGSYKPKKQKAGKNPREKNTKNVKIGHADLQMATRYVQDVSKQTDRVIENSRMYICQISK